MDAPEPKNASLDLPAEKIWGLQGIDARALTLRPDGSIDNAHLSDEAGASPATGPASGRNAGLPLLVDGDTAQLELGEVLGYGGMGVVHTATQHGLQREVAVKVVSPGKRPGRRAAALVREARVTGAIAHPNVVPIHLLGVDQRGLPVMVMKRVEGRSWLELIDDDALRLEDHLRLIDQVAHALHHAHSCGVVHLDLKPANVLVGRYGQVYVADWGLAATTGNDRPGVPTAADIRSVVGSPSYMAPEAASGLGGEIGVRTDVFLLGATLFHVLTGSAPYAGDTPYQRVFAAYQGHRAPWPPDVPAGLAAICDRAMSRQPRDRYPDAEAFRAAVAQWVQQTGVQGLLTKATERLERLNALIVDGSEPASSGHLRKVFTECRFGFRQVLKTHPGEPRATAGLQAALEVMIDHELRAGSPGAAQALLDELPQANPFLRRRVHDAQASAREADARLAALEHDLDESFGDHLRVMLLAGSGLLGAGVHVLLGHLQRAELLAVDRGLYGALVALLALPLVLAPNANDVFKSVFLDHGANRRATWLIRMTALHAIAVMPLCLLAGVPLAGGLLWLQAVNVFAFASIGTTVDRYALVGVPPNVLSMAALLAWPAFQLEAVGIGNGLALCLLAAMQARRHSEAGSAR